MDGQAGQRRRSPAGLANMVAAAARRRGRQTAARRTLGQPRGATDGRLRCRRRRRQHADADDGGGAAASAAAAATILATQK